MDEGSIEKVLSIVATGLLKQSRTSNRREFIKVRMCSDLICIYPLRDSCLTAAMVIMVLLMGFGGQQDTGVTILL